MRFSARRRAFKETSKRPRAAVLAWPLTPALVYYMMSYTKKKEGVAMGIRTVRLDEETEKALEQIVTVTRLSVSGAMKKGLLVLRNEVVREAQRIPYDIYKELDLGPGGYAVAPATRTRRGVQAAIRRKLRR